MTGQPRHRTEEADIGSGEKPPSQRDTEKLIEDVGKKKEDAPTSPDKKQPEAPGQQSGKR